MMSKNDKSMNESYNYDSKENIIELNPKSVIRFTIEKHTYFRPIRGGERKFEVALIVLKSTKSGKDMVHPFSQFIIDSFRGTSIKTKIDYGRKITAFLNFILDNKKRFKIDNFSDLEFYHASEFLNVYCGNLQRNTVIGYQNKLAQFYYFLSKSNVLRYCEPEEFEIVEKTGKNGRIIETIIAPFPDVSLPEAKVTSRNEHDMPKELQALLLEVAYEEVNNIAFGVAMQMFGGLRMSEVIRMKYSCIRTLGYYGDEGLLVVLRDDDDGTRPDLKNNDGKGYVKRPRVQQADSPYGLLSGLLRQQREKYKAKNGSDAVFINAKGLPLSYGSYVYYFGILKKKFLSRLKAFNNPELKAQALVLESARWFTHIGRGIFSTNLIEAVDNPVIAQIKRGDLDSNSIGVYIANSKRLGKSFEEVSEKTYTNLINKINNR